MGLQVDGSEQGIGRQADEIAINKLRTGVLAVWPSNKCKYARTYARMYAPRPPRDASNSRPDNPAAYPLLGVNGRKPQAMVLGFRV